MSLRIRADGRVLCAAMHPEEPGDTYLHDGISYRLTVELKALVTEPMYTTAGRGGHAKHGEWWWANEVPAGVVLEKGGEMKKAEHWHGPACAAKCAKKLASKKRKKAKR